MTISQGTATFVAAMVALVGVAVSVFVSLYQSRQIARATIAAGLRARKVDAFVMIIRYVATAGVAIQDHIYNITEAEWGGGQYGADYAFGPARRKVKEPPRDGYAEASALVAAYGDKAIRDAFEAWTKAVYAWEGKLAILGWNWSEGEQSRPSQEQVRSERDGERDSRHALGNVINAALLRLQTDA